MATQATLADYERAEVTMALEEGRRGLMIHAVITVVVSAALIAVNVLWASEFPWSPFPVVGMSIGVVVHYLFGVRWAGHGIQAKQARVERRAAELHAA